MTRKRAIGVKRLTGVDYKEVLSKSRERRIVRGRAVYSYLRREKGDVSGMVLMRELGLASGTISWLAQMGRELVHE